MERPSKRPRTGSTSQHREGDHVVEDELSMNPVQFSIAQDPLYELDKGRANAASRLKSRFESIFEKYERDFTGIGDEIDFHTGEVVINNGHLEAFLNEDSPISESDYYSDEASGESDADGGLAPDHSLIGSVGPQPPSDPIDTRDKWLLPNDLPDFAGLDISWNSNEAGSFARINEDVQLAPALLSGQNNERRFSYATPRLNLGSLQYNSHGHAHQPHTLSKMLTQAKRSRFTDAKSFLQAQKSASATRVSEQILEDHEDPESEAGNGRMWEPNKKHSPIALHPSQNHYQPTSAQSTARHVDGGQADSRTKKRFKDTHTNPAVYKVKKPRTFKVPKPNRRLKGRANIEPAAGDGVEKRKRGRPRKVPVADDGASGPGYEPGLGGGSAFQGADPLRLQRSIGTSHGARTKSGRYHKRPEFYGDIISTLEIEQSLLVSDDDESEDYRRDVEPAKASNPTLWNIFEPGSGQADTKSPAAPSQGTIRDSQDPTSSMPRSSIQEPNRPQSPQYIHQQVIRDSQDPCSSLPSSLPRPKSVPPLTSEETLREVFSRNNIDSSYGFSDDEEGDIGVSRHRPASEDNLNRGTARNEAITVTTEHEDQIVHMQADHDVPQNLNTHGGEGVSIILNSEDTEIRVEGTLAGSSPKSPPASETILFTSSTFAPPEQSHQPDSTSTKSIAKHTTWVVEIPCHSLLPSDQQQQTSQEDHSPNLVTLASDTIEVLGNSPQQDPDYQSDPIMADLPAIGTADAPLPPCATNAREGSASQARSPSVWQQSSPPTRLSLEKSDSFPEIPIHVEGSTIGEISSPQGGPTAVQQLSSPSKSLVLEELDEIPDIPLDVEASMRKESSPAHARSPSVQRHSSPPRRLSPERTKSNEVKLVTPEAPRTREGSVKTSSGSRRRVLALSNLVPEQASQNGEEDELSISSPVKNSTSFFRGLFPRSSVLDQRSSATPNGRSTSDPSKPSHGSNHSQGSSTADGTRTAPGNNAQTPTRKVGFGFANARGAAPVRRSSSFAMSRIRTPGTALHPNGSTSATKTMEASRPKPGLQPTIASKVTQFSPLAQRTLTANTTNDGAKTPKDRKRKLREAMGEFGDNDNDDDEGELVQTPGGTRRRCGKDGFTCDRDFCMVCCL